MPACDTFCSIMSTLIDRSARARNSRAAMPGRSGTPVTVSLASELSETTADTIACSISGSSGSIQVPGSHVNAERT